MEEEQESDNDSEGQSPNYEETLNKLLKQTQVASSNAMNISLKSHCTMTYNQQQQMSNQQFREA